MLFFINTTASSVGEKLRALVGLPSASRLNKPIPGHRPIDHTHHTNGNSYDGIAVVVRGSHEEKKSRGFCTESACHINEGTGTGKKVSSEDGTRKGSKKDVQNDMKGESKSIEKGGDGVVKCVGEHLDDASHVTLESDGDDILDMYLVILDVPDGGDFYKYPCHSAHPILSHIPSFMHAVVDVDIPVTGNDIDDTKIAGVDAEEVVEEQKCQPPGMEGDQVAEQKESENAMRENTDQHDIVSSITGADVSFGSLEVLTDNSSVAGSASTITTHETLKGKYSAQFPQITASNIDQITRRFISDYQANELRK
jgi:hypothetical protein